MPSAPAAKPPFRPVLRQRWSSLAFFHWRVDPELVRARLPKGLEPETFEDSAWMAIVPFTMSRIRLGFLPPVPAFRAFPELNLRTYVRRPDGTSGVWFFSLEADHGIAVGVGRRAFHLPYHETSMVVRTQADGTIDYRALRREPPEGRTFTTLRYLYRPDLSQGTPAAPGSLEAFLCDRYAFISTSGDGRHFHLGRVHHPPYRLCPVDVRVCDAGLFQWNGFPLPGRPPDHVVAAHPVDVAAPLLKRLEDVQAS